MSIYSFNKPEEVNPAEAHIPQVEENPETAQSAAAIKDIAKEEGKDNGKNKVVVLDGPCSHVYTQALNIAFANESIQMVTSTVTSATTINQANAPKPLTGMDKEGEADSYVYALGDHIESAEEAMEAYNAVSKAMASGKYKNVYLAVENALSTSMHQRCSSMVSHAMKMGVTVVAKSGTAIEALTHKLIK